MHKIVEAFQRVVPLHSAFHVERTRFLSRALTSPSQKRTVFHSVELSPRNRLDTKQNTDSLLNSLRPHLEKIGYVLSDEVTYNSATGERTFVISKHGKKSVES